jgi:hypothetical protein
VRRLCRGASVEARRRLRQGGVVEGAGGRRRQPAGGGLGGGWEAGSRRQVHDPRSCLKDTRTLSHPPVTLPPGRRPTAELVQVRAAGSYNSGRGVVGDNAATARPQRAAHHSGTAMLPMHLVLGVAPSVPSRASEISSGSGDRAPAAAAVRAAAAAANAGTCGSGGTPPLHGSRGREGASVQRRRGRCDTVAPATAVASSPWRRAPAVRPALAPTQPAGLPRDGRVRRVHAKGRDSQGKHTELFQLGKIFDLYRQTPRTAWVARHRSATRR